ncbi:hypothetical protein H4R33_001487 [Dimargaris cristalligena]|uniref:Uncharacterized protein n=1 Tax=Dimargaris cristalligena TaxID=215637 RepID=A0A4P9ZK60_9FUNG|nr:hypothetical protein H4R33_001487 [Dimargaris cristalligena]RKP33646.1 hypothetical protein BJ085DRAFT_34910 [Dimargaris cristalligena]|eukprot:RKP33646.1 hypothetical protein BJ085DRAFT_34910 [Dimargaris cristalligena]
MKWLISLLLTTALVAIMGIHAAAIPETPRAVTPMAKGALGMLHTKPPVASLDLLNRREYPNYTPEHRRRTAHSEMPYKSLVKREPIPMPNPKPFDSNSVALTPSFIGYPLLDYPKHL